MHHHIFRPWSLVLLIFLQSVNCNLEPRILDVRQPQKYWVPDGHKNPLLDEPLQMGFLHVPPHFALSDGRFENKIGYLTQYYQAVACRCAKYKPNEQENRLGDKIRTENRLKSGDTIERGFKSLWENENLQASQVQAWLEFLAYVMGNHLSDPSIRPMPFARISIIAGIHSLQIKFGRNEDIITHTDGMIAAMQEFAPSEFHGNSDQSAWGIAFTGHFGRYLEHRHHLKELTKNDELFGKALADDRKLRSAAATIILTEFEQYNSYRRLLALAVFKQIFGLCKREGDEFADNLEKFLQTEGTYFSSYEEELIKNIKAE